MARMHPTPDEQDALDAGLPHESDGFPADDSELPGQKVPSETPTIPETPASIAPPPVAAGAADGAAISTGGDEPVTPSRRGFPPVPDSARPSYVFLGVVSAISLFADISTKVWAEIIINKRGLEPMAVIGENLNITLAYNRGGAWGLFANAGEMVRKPFFLGVSVFAIFFILSLYSRLHPTQRALKWGLPLVLGGALGNLSDRITRSQVIDFIDYRADWVLSLNSFIGRHVNGWVLTDHWPTFNVADIAICIGVILMGVDMFTHRNRAKTAPPEEPPAAPEAPVPPSSPEALPQ